MPCTLSSLFPKMQVSVNRCLLLLVLHYYCYYHLYHLHYSYPVQIFFFPSGAQSSVCVVGGQERPREKQHLAGGRRCWTAANNTRPRNYSQGLLPTFSCSYFFKHVFYRLHEEQPAFTAPKLVRRCLTLGNIRSTREGGGGGHLVQCVAHHPPQERRLATFLDQRPWSSWVYPQETLSWVGLSWAQGPGLRGSLDTTAAQEVPPY